MKSSVVILTLYLLLLIVTERGCFAAKTTNCAKPSDFSDDKNCQCDVDKVCFRKCCPENQVLKKIDNTNCVDGHYKKNLWEERWDGNKADIQVLNGADSHLVMGFPCSDGTFTQVDENFTVNRKGELTFDGLTSKFCTDYVNGSGKVLSYVCLRDEQLSNVVEMSPSAPNPFIVALLMVSILFTLITFIVFAVESKLRTLQGKCLMCYLLCALSYSAILCLIKLKVLQTGTIVCCSAGYLTLYSALAGFFWLNVMCFDLWLALKRLVHRKGDMKNFLLYSLYAWGSPLVVVCIAMSAQFIDIPWLEIKPSFGENTCWFTKDIDSDKKAKLWYFSNIVTLLLIENLVLFIYTVHIILTHNGQKKHLQRNDSQRNTETENRRFFLFVKLFFMMGLNWIGEILPTYISLNEEQAFVIGIPNLLQGFSIFVIFVCKRRVLALLNQKLYPSKIFIQERKPRKSSAQTTMSTASTVRSSRASGTRTLSFS